MLFCSGQFEGVREMREKMKIKAHKGGRDKNIIFRVTEKEKGLIDIAKNDLSYSDFFVKKAKDTLRRRKNLKK